MRTLCLFLALATPALATSLTQAYTFSTIGVAGSAPGTNCTTFGPTAVMRASGINLGVAQGGTGCGQLEMLQNVLGVSNLVTANSSVSGSFVNSNGSFSGSGTAAAKAAANLLGVDARFSFPGVPDGGTVRGSEALAVFSEDLTTPIGPITNGTVRYTLALTGSQSVAPSVSGRNSSGESFSYLAYRSSIGNRIFPIFFASSNSSSSYAQVFGNYQLSSGDGITLGSSSVSVNRNFVLDVPFDTTSPFSGTFFLYAGAYPGGNADIDVLFNNTLHVLSVEAFNSQGQSISLVRSSDTSSVPEPSHALLTAGLIVAGIRLKMRAHGRRCHSAPPAHSGRG